MFGAAFNDKREVGFLYFSFKHLNVSHQHLNNTK